jgi:hypothetical protein
MNSPKEYRINKGDTVLVIEIAKDYVRYFKLKKPEETKKLIKM